MKKIYSAATLQEVYIVLNLLNNAGIELKVFNENAQGGIGELPFTHNYPELWLLDENDTEQAQRIIADYNTAQPDTTLKTCSHCGEQNPGNFESCWQCGEHFSK